MVLTLRRLAQEYLVGMWCSVEEARLQFIRHNQVSLLRVATGQDVDKTIEAEGLLPGKVYLPSSVTHGPRYMQVKYHGTMSIITLLGKPSWWGLLDDYDEYRRVLLEASAFKTGRGLRQLFFSVVINEAPAAVLWEEFKVVLSEDYLERDSDNVERAYGVLAEIDWMLRGHGRTARPS